MCSPPEMTCGFLIQLVFCKKKTMWFIGVEVERETSAPSPKKNPGSAPASQIFKGRAYELKDRAYAFCLNKQQAHLLLYLGVIFSKQEKIVTYPKFAKIQRPLHSECIKNTTVEFTFGKSFSALQRRTSSFF